MARYRTGIETRSRILEATRALLGEVGLDGTTIKAICQRAAIKPGSFYNLFESKDEAILSVIADAIAAVDPRPDGAGHDSIPELVDAYLDFVLGQPDLAKIYLQLAVSGGLTDPVLAHRMLGHHHRRVDRFSDALRRESLELSEEEARLRSERLLATLNGLAFVSFLDPEFDLRTHVKDLLPTLV
ncbi:MAG: TetR/AcrR family transcriptional regulator [Acidimicrobiia bacterium]